MKYVKLLSVLGLLFMVLIYSCKKDKETVVDNSSVSVRDNSMSENLFADIKRVVEEAANDEGQSARGEKSGSYSFGTCATVTINPAWVDTT